MARKPKLQVFLAHSFDEKPPSWSDVSDMEVAQWFEKQMKSLGWKVVTGKKIQARPIGSKISNDVNESKAVIAIFTGKQKIDNKLLPSAWVLCECAYALGRFEDSDYMVAGFREKGVDPKDLALLSVSGMEFPDFDRTKLDENKERFKDYLRDLELRITYGTGGQIPLIAPTNLPFKQVRLHKIFLIYRNGFCTVQNINEITIHDPERFYSECAGKMKHHIWNYRKSFPGLDVMRKNSIDKRKQMPFFNAKLDYHKNNRYNIPLPITVERYDEKDISFFVDFADADGQPLKLKPHDTIRYQYAWGFQRFIQ